MLHAVLLVLSCFCARNDSVIVILCRNEDLSEIVKTLKNFEEKFNNEYRYPYVFLNDKEWTDEFRTSTKAAISGQASYGVIDKRDWSMPAVINKGRAQSEWKKMESKNVPYAGMESYHNMCRFFSRTFYKHPLLAKYKYYWRIEPGVSFRCKIDFDPFDFMEDNKLVYGFTITLLDFRDSIASLWKVTSEFLQEHQNEIPKNISPLKFMFDKTGYNTCHFWSNFEIASFEFFRGALYNKYMDHLESKGGFYYERWGDAPVHSLAVALFLDRKQVYHFDQIGYTHPPYTNCPASGNQCDCTEKESFKYKPGSCYSLYAKDVGLQH